MNLNAVSAGGGKFMGYRVHAAAGGVAQRLHASNRAQALDKRGEHRAVALQFAIKAQLFAQVEDGRAVVAQRPTDNQQVTRRKCGRAPVDIGRDSAHPGGVDKQFVRRAATHHFGVAGDDGDIRRFGRFRHAVDHRLQRLHRQPFFNDKAAGEITRHRAADRHVVGGAANRQLADITAGEEQRVNHVAVGGESQTVAVGGQRSQRQACLIFLLRQPGVGESFHKQAVDKLLHRQTAAPVR